MQMSDEDLARYIGMGSSEEEILELLRQKERAEGIQDDSYGGDPTVRAGNVHVPNFMDPIKGLFARGRASKAIEKADNELPVKRAQRDQDIQSYIRNAMDQSLNQPVDQSAIAGASPAPMPSVPPMGGAPQVPAAPPPAPAMGQGPIAAPGPSPAAAPSAVAPVAPLPAAPMPKSPLDDGPPAAAGFPGAQAAAPAPAADGLMAKIIDLLKKGGRV